MTHAEMADRGDDPHRPAPERRAERVRQGVSTGLWYLVLSAVAVITVFPFVWMLLTSLKGPTDPVTSVPPQFIPAHPTLANYGQSSTRCRSRSSS